VARSGLDVNLAAANCRDTQHREQRSPNSWFVASDRRIRSTLRRVGIYLEDGFPAVLGNRGSS
jgi:hypothetical protein